jgi:glycosyltransferase involved in cell wall biosynthesis
MITMKQSTVSAPLPLPVSVCIPVRNEEQHLPACLAALSAFDEVVVVDSGSSDQTVALAEAAGACVLQFAWNGAFPKKRNWTLRNHAFKHPWVLFLDTDERVTPAFVEELQRTLPDTRHSGFWISFDNWFTGRRLRYGDVFRKLALFKVDAGEYERFPEDYWSHLDMEVHEHPVLVGTQGEILARLEHHDDRGLAHHRAKHEAYAQWEARRYAWLQQADDSEWQKLNRRQQFKYRNLKQWWLPWLYWVVAYVLKKGFLDGQAGWTFNHLKRKYFQRIRDRIGQD